MVNKRLIADKGPRTATDKRLGLAAYIVPGNGLTALGGPRIDAHKRFIDAS